MKTLLIVLTVILAFGRCGHLTKNHNVVKFIPGVYARTSTHDSVPSMIRWWSAGRRRLPALMISYGNGDMKKCSMDSCLRWNVKLKRFWRDIRKTAFTGIDPDWRSVFFWYGCAAFVQRTFKILEAMKRMIVSLVLVFLAVTQAQSLVEVIRSSQNK